MIKKLLTASLATILVAIAIPATSMAAAAQTDISGTVTNNGKVVSGAKVTVVCDNNSRKDTTDSSGGYLVHFPAAQCPNGATVYVTATDSKKGGDTTGKVNADTSKLNVSIVNVALPEFGTYAAIGATLLGGGAFMVIRRRQLGATRS
jgi:hypothetical protein